MYLIKQYNISQFKLLTKIKNQDVSHSLKTPTQHVLKFLLQKQA